jgi:hypothetical protein
MFQKQIGCCISSHLLLHYLGVSSSRRRQGIHMTPRLGPSESEAPPPSPRVAWGGVVLVKCTKQSAARERSSSCPGASTAIDFFCYIDFTLYINVRYI